MDSLDDDDDDGDVFADDKKNRVRLYVCRTINGSEENQT